MSVDRLVYRWPDGAHERAVASAARVRRACATADAAPLATVIESVRDAGFPALRAAGLLGDLAGRPQRTVAVWLASIDDRPAGMAATVTADGEIGPRHSIAWLLVGTGFRRRGVGSALAAAALADARARGAREVWVETRSDWTTAGAFWQALGFREPGH